VESIPLLCKSEVLQPSDLPVAILNNETVETLSNELVTLQAGDDPQKMKILASLETSRWNKTLAAKDLNISRATLWRKMKAYSLHND
jgi:transcriptional regulator of acetoin/glycerol metabolism